MDEDRKLCENRHLEKNMPPQGDCMCSITPGGAYGLQYPQPASDADSTALDCVPRLLPVRFSWWTIPKPLTPSWKMFPTVERPIAESFLNGPSASAGPSSRSCGCAAHSNRILELTEKEPVDLIHAHSPRSAAWAFASRSFKKHSFVYEFAPFGRCRRAIRTRQLALSPLPS